MTTNHQEKRLEAARRNPTAVLLCYKDAIALAGVAHLEITPRALLDEALQRATDLERDLRMTTAENRDLRAKLASQDGRAGNGARRVDCPRGCGRTVERKTLNRPNGCCIVCYRAEVKAGLKKRKSRDAEGETKPAPE